MSDKLTLKDKVLVFLYLIERGMPPEREGQPVWKNQQRVFGLLTDATDDEIETAFYEAMKAGYAEKVSDGN